MLSKFCNFIQKIYYIKSIYLFLNYQLVLIDCGFLLNFNQFVISFWVVRDCCVDFHFFLFFQKVKYFFNCSFLTEYVWLFIVFFLMLLCCVKIFILILVCQSNLFEIVENDDQIDNFHLIRLFLIQCDNFLI